MTDCLVAGAGARGFEHDVVPAQAVLRAELAELRAELGRSLQAESPAFSHLAVLDGLFRPLAA